MIFHAAADAAGCKVLECLVLTVGVLWRIALQHSALLQQKHEQILAKLAARCFGVDLVGNCFYLAVRISAHGRRGFEMLR